jgi:hypothetical protein
MLILDEQDAEDLLRQQAAGALQQDRIDAAEADDIERAILFGAAERAVPLLRDKRISIPELNVYVLASLWAAFEEGEDTFVGQFLAEFASCADERVQASWPELAACLDAESTVTPRPLTRAISHLKQLDLWPW